jgi:hypothetical protein
VSLLSTVCKLRSLCDCYPEYWPVKRRCLFLKLVVRPYHFSNATFNGFARDSAPPAKAKSAIITINSILLMPWQTVRQQPSQEPE